MCAAISRPVFLRAALVAALAGCARPHVGSENTATTTTTVGPPDWTQLTATIEGGVLLPTDEPQFTTAKRIFNSRFDARVPAAVVTARSVADVQHAMSFAAAHHIAVAVRGGGHSYTGASSPDQAMVLDLRGLPAETRVDGDTVTVPAATQLYAVHAALASAGRAIPTGSCPTVGAAGLALGGGLGNDSRHAGLTCDALRSVSAVLPSGELVTASADEHPDLFWALRGGGGGNFAVSTALTFATFPTADTDVLRVDFPPAEAARVIVGWQSWLAAADRAVWGLVDISADAAGKHCHVLSTCPAGAGRGVAQAITAAVGVQPSGIEYQTLGHMDLVRYLAGGSSTSAPRGFVAGSDVIERLTAPAAQAIIDAMDQWPTDNGAAAVIVDTLGGAVADVDPAGTAFPWRRHAAVLQWYTEGADFGRDAQWLSAAHQAVQHYSVGGYVDYLEPDTQPSRYFGENLPRLAAIRTDYDPDRVLYSGFDL